MKVGWTVSTRGLKIFEMTSELPMGPSDGLSAYLQTQSGPIESQGEFTVDSHRAFQKLARFQLPTHGHWVVKLVQAAVAMGASGIDFQFGRSQLFIEISLDVPPTAGDILKDTLTGGLGLENSRQHLVTGLRSIWGRYPEELVWESHRVDGWDRVCAITGETWKREESCSNFFGLTFRVCSKCLPNRSKFLRVNLKQTMDELQALETLCWVSPIPVRVDKRLITQPYPKSTPHTLTIGGPRQGVLGLWMEETSVGGFPAHLASNPGKEMPAGHFRCNDPGSLHGWFEHRSRGAAGKFHASSLLSVYCTYSGVTENNLWWVKDGALIGPVSLGNWGPHPLNAYFPGDGMRTDLSGFKPASTDFTHEVEVIVDSLERLWLELRAQKAPEAVLNALSEKLKKAKQIGLGENLTEYRSALGDLESIDLTPETLRSYLDTLSELEALNGESLTGSALFIKAYAKFFWRGLDFEPDRARRWWEAVLNYYAGRREGEWMDPAEVHAALRLSQLDQPSAEMEPERLRTACRSTIALYLLSFGEPDPLMSLALLAYEAWKPGTLSRSLWETILVSAETDYSQDPKCRLVEELRYSEDLERLLPASLQPRLHQIQVMGPTRQGFDSGYSTLAAFKAHWKQISWLKTGAKTLSVMTVGLLGFKLGSLGFYTLGAAALFSHHTLNGELVPHWNDRRAKELLATLQLPEAFDLDPGVESEPES